MKKKTTKFLSLFFVFLLTFTSVFSFVPAAMNRADAATKTFVETFKTFAPADPTKPNSYLNGSFIGVNGVEWEYTGGRYGLDQYKIDDEGIMLNRTGEICSLAIPGGISSFSVDLLKAFTSSNIRKIELWINDKLEETFTLLDVQTTQRFEVSGINIEGTFKLELRNISSGSGNTPQITIDNITWTSYDGGGTGGDPTPKVSPVTANPTPGAVEEGTKISLSTSTDDSTVHYAVYKDSSSPLYEDAIFKIYTTPIEVNEPLTIKAYATKSGYEDSDMKEFSYTIKPPVILEEIATARAKDNDQEVIVQGIVTGLIGNNAFIQDNTAGIYLFNGSNNISDLIVGNEVKVKGKLGEFNNLKQISNVELLEVVSTKNELPSPKPVTLPLNESLESQLVKVENLSLTVVPADKESNYSLTATDGTNNIDLRIDTSINPKIPSSNFKVGDVVTVIANVGQYRENYQLMIRTINDIVVDQSANTVKPVTATPAPGTVEIDTDVSLSTVTEGATIYYTIDGSEPTQDSTEYTTPIKIDKDTTIKAIAIKEDMKNSIISTFKYTIPAEAPGDGEGDGTWANPFTVAQSILIQDKSVKSVKGYIVGVPTSQTTVQFENFTSDTALAIADTPGETDTNKMLYIQLGSPFRPGFALKDHPERKGMYIRVTGSLENYFSTHSGIKAITQLEQMHTGPDETPPVITHTKAADGNIYEDLTIAATVTDDRNVASVKLYYRTKGQPEYKSLNMTLKNNLYEATILKSDLNIAGLEYYIEASDGANIKTSPEEKSTPYEVLISNTDIVPPVITNLTPARGTSTDDNLRPIISAEYSDNVGINKDSIKLYLDGKDVTKDSVITESKIVYTPKDDLEIGRHLVRLEVSDNAPTPQQSIIEWDFYVGTRSFNFYFGQLHSHTNLSDGTGSIDNAFEFARDSARADFFAVTDHSNWFDNEKDLMNESITAVSQSNSDKWKTINTKAVEYSRDGSFVGIPGYEMTWSGGTGGWGHINTFNTPWFASRSNSKMNLQAYYNKIAQWPESINQLNHPGKTFGDFADFGFYSPTVDNVVQLIEVGNGEGPIRGSGYFPSYEYYTRALDKGWHLAPSNNQDNHKGNWILANTARTVIVAEALTRDSLYDGIRDLRVYSTEDNNLEIMYKINDQIMGSQLGRADKLNVSISIVDPDAGDNIAKVELISDGGAVSASKTFNSNIVEWNFELDPRFSYYYVRVTQADKDIAVTAPIWVGEVSAFGLSNIEVSQSLTEVNTSIDISATVFNNESKMLTEAVVDFYVDSIKPENKIGSSIVNNIGQGATALAKVTWKPNRAGEYNIYAVANIQGIDKQFTISTKLEVVPKGSATKVMIDYAHSNHYVNGDYAGMVLTLTEMLKSKNMIMVENHDTLTDEVLEGISILVITSPQPRDKGEVKRSKLSDEEIQAVKKFTDRGGSLIVTSRANYGDGTGDYQNSVQGNKLLNAIGSNIIFNSDQVVDPVTNGGQAYRLYFNTYTSTKYNLTSGLDDKDLYSFYSGCSILLKDGGDAKNVDFLVKGHSTTKNDNAGNTPTGFISTEEGNVYALAAEVLPSGGKLIVSGTTFFSDFEMSGDNRYSNIQIADQILDWLEPELKVEVKTIKEIRAGMPENFGELFSIEGRITSMSEAYSKENNLNNAFFEVIYVQDETGGITVFGVSQTKLPLGTKVRLIGTAGEYEGDYQLQIRNEEKHLIVLEDPIVEVAPKVMSTKDSMLKTNEGWLVKVQGKVTRIDKGSLYINDGSGVARIYLNGYIGVKNGTAETLGKWDSTIKVGDIVSAIGLASKDPEGARLRVRDAAEIVKVSDGQLDPGTPTDPEYPEETKKPDKPKEDKAQLPKVEKEIKALSGGKLEIENIVVLEIPADALQEDVKVIIEKAIDIPAYNAIELASEVYRFIAGESNKFHKPVTITFRYEKEKVKDESKLGIYYYHEGRSEWIYIGGVVNSSNSTISAQVDHFTNFAVFENTNLATLTDMTNHWSQEFVYRLLGMEIVSGVKQSDGTYKYNPQDNITREQFAKLIATALNLKLEDNPVLAFKDANEIQAWARPYVAAAYKAGIISGSKDAQGNVYFNPSKNITRAEIATMIGRSLERYSARELSFADKDNIPAWALEYIKTAVDNGILSGYPDNTFKPNNSASRAEAAKIIYMLLRVMGI